MKIQNGVHVQCKYTYVTENNENQTQPSPGGLFGWSP